MLSNGFNKWPSFIRYETKTACKNRGNERLDSPETRGRTNHDDWKKVNEMMFNNILLC